MIDSATLQIIVRGNPVDGFLYVGPFLNRDAAIAWADGDGSGDWWLAPMEYTAEFSGGLILDEE